METQYTWKTKMFSRKYYIYRYENLTGELKKEGWSRKIYGEMSGRKLIFETKGFFRHETRIIDQNDSSVIGTISFTSWKSKSQVSYNNKEFIWQFDNFWRTKWSLSNENGFLARYQSHGFKGTIDSYTEDVVLVLAGFFIRNYFRQRSAEAAAAS